MPGIDQIRLEVERRVSNPVFLARILERVINSLTSRRVNEINKIVGRASNIMPDSKFWCREMPDYQRYLAEYVSLKRKLGLHRKRWCNDPLTDEEIVEISLKIADLTEKVKVARQQARELREAIWYGNWKERDSNQERNNNASCNTSL